MGRKQKGTETTRQKLINAFWQLYQEHPIEKISIGSLTRLAGCNRSTFYEYFQDIYDLLNQIEDELIEELQAALLEEFDGRPLPRNMRELNRRTLVVLGGRFEKVLLLLGPSGDPQFPAKVKSMILPLVSRLASLPYEKQVSDYVITFVVSSYLGMISHWYENDRDMPFEKLLPLAQGLVAKGVFGYAGLTLAVETPETMPETPDAPGASGERYEN